MFDGGGRNGFGLGLVAGICATLVFCLFVWWPLGELMTPKTDTLAQWVMAIVSVVAALISLYVVFLIKDTLTQTMETNRAAVSAANAANEANIIFRAEQRPWVTMVREVDCQVQISDFGITLEWAYSLVNKGKSPAYDVCVRCKAIKRPHLQNMTEQVINFARESIARPRIHRTKIIFPGETIEYDGPHRLWDSYLPRKEPVAEGHPMLMVCITYRLGLESESMGADAYMFGFSPDGLSSQPVTAKMLGYSSARYVQ